MAKKSFSKTGISTRDTIIAALNQAAETTPKSGKPSAKAKTAIKWLYDNQEIVTDEWSRLTETQEQAFQDIEKKFFNQLALVSHEQ